MDEAPAGDRWLIGTSLFILSSELLMFGVSALLFVQGVADGWTLAAMILISALAVVSCVAACGRFVLLRRHLRARAPRSRVPGGTA